MKSTGKLLALLTALCLLLTLVPAATMEDLGDEVLSEAVELAVPEEEVALGGREAAGPPDGGDAPAVSAADDALVVIESPGEGATVDFSSIPLMVSLKPAIIGNTIAGDVLAPKISVAVLDSRGGLFFATDVAVNDAPQKARSGEIFKLTTLDVDVGGIYTIRVKPLYAENWESVQVYAEGPSYPVSRESDIYTVTPKQREITIDLAGDNLAHIDFEMTSDDENAFYADFVEDGNEGIIKYKAMSEYRFTAAEDDPTLYRASGWIEYTGKKVGAATLHMYNYCHGRNDHHAVTIHVIDSSATSTATPTAAPQPTPTAAPKPTPTAAPTKKPTGKSVVHEGFVVVSPVAGRSYPVNGEIEFEVDTRKWIPVYVNGFISSKVNKILLEVEKDGVNQVRRSHEYTSAEIYAVENLLGVSRVGGAWRFTFTPEETGVYTVKVGFENTRVGVFNREINADNLVGSFTFNVVKPASLAKARVTLKTTAYTYNGKAKKPVVKVKLGGKTLKKGTDYTVSYQNNIKPGKATVTVKGVGLYAGTVKKAFRINPKKATGLRLAAGKQGLTASWNRDGTATGYQVQYALNKGFTGAKTKTVARNTTVKYTFRKLKAGKTYYVRVRAYKKVGSTKYVSAWSAKKRVKVK